MIRRYEEKDSSQIEDMLITEGIPDIEMAFKNHETFVMEEDGEVKGFFTIKQEHGYPSVQHFCIDRSYREGNINIGRGLMKELKNTVKGMGVNKMILHSESEVVDKFISYYFKKKPYAFRKDVTFYFVEV